MGLFSRLRKKVETHFRLRPHRIAVSPSQKIHFELYPNNARISIRNISFSGVGLARKDMLGELNLGQRLKGCLCIDGKALPVELIIRHLTSEVCGSSFEPANQQIDAAIESYLSVEIRSAELRPVRQDLLTTGPMGEPHWFVDGKGNEVYYLLDKSAHVAHFHLHFLGHYAEGGSGISLRLGHVSETTHSESAGLKGSDLINYYDELPREVVGLLRRFVASVVCIPDAHRDRLVGLLNPQ